MVASSKRLNRSTACNLDDAMVKFDNIEIDKDHSDSNDEEEVRHKGPWGPQEDRCLTNFVEKNGETNWGAIAKKLNRSAKSCRLRWCNQLSPNINREQFTPEEDEIITSIVCNRGGKWSQIAKLLQGRTDNQLKNRWNSTLIKSVIKLVPKLLDKPSGKSSKPAHKNLKVNRLSRANSHSAPSRASTRISGGIQIQAPLPSPGACLPNSFMPPCYVAAHPEESLKYAPPATLPALAAPPPAPVFNHLDGFSLCPPGHETDDPLYPHLFSNSAPIGNFTAMMQEASCDMGEPSFTAGL